MSMAQPVVIQNWPGIVGIANKVPTVVSYRAGNYDLRSWGFECPSPRNLELGTRVVDNFKLFLNEAFLEDTFKDRPQSTIGTHADVQKWFGDFLGTLYRYIGTHISDYLKLTDWKFATVHYVFSVPTIWDGSAVVRTFENIVKNAGFGNGGIDHFLELDLTEAEAAAVYTAKSSKHQRPVSFEGEDSESEPSNRAFIDGPSMQKGNILLVCDSGGGTTVGFPRISIA
jgi:hypothetical protein